MERSCTKVYCLCIVCYNLTIDDALLGCKIDGSLANIVVSKSLRELIPLLCLFLVLDVRIMF